MLNFSDHSPLSPIFRTHSQVPYPVSPLLATSMRILLPGRFCGTKTAGVYTNNSHSGTCDSALSTLLNSFRFTLLRTLLHLEKNQLFYFQSIPHSLSKTAGWGRVAC